MSCEKRPSDGKKYEELCQAEVPLTLGFAVNDENPNEYLFEFSKPVVPGMGLSESSVKVYLVPLFGSPSKRLLETQAVNFTIDEKQPNQEWGLELNVTESTYQKEIKVEFANSSNIKDESGNSL
jgi:hypothetical protein